MAKWYALSDCNNFYASCERIFRPDLDGKPIVVLSNNDGCVIARSDEAKALGVGMGTPFFKIKPLIQRHGVRVFSSNYALYGDVSARVMNAYSRLAPEWEPYSIDESFLNLSIFPRPELEPFAWHVRRKVKQWTHIPVSIGIAQTKTEAKVANKWAKKQAEPRGVFVLDDGNRREILSHYDVGDVWGVGRQTQKKLAAHHITTAWQLSQVSDAWAKKNMSIVGLRTVLELRGFSCIPMLEPRQPTWGHSARP